MCGIPPSPSQSAQSHLSPPPSSSSAFFSLSPPLSIDSSTSSSFYRGCFISHCPMSHRSAFSLSLLSPSLPLSPPLRSLSILCHATSCPSSPALSNDVLQWWRGREKEKDGKGGERERERERFTSFPIKSIFHFQEFDIQLNPNNVNLPIIFQMKIHQKELRLQLEERHTKCSNTPRRMRLSTSLRGRKCVVFFSKFTTPEAFHSETR